MNSQCINKRSDGRFVCMVTGIVFPANTIEPIHCCAPVAGSTERLPRCKPPELLGPGLGDAVSTALALVGITEARVTAWLGRPCGCGERRQRLNRLGCWAASAAAQGAEKAKEGLTKLLG